MPKQASLHTEATVEVNEVTILPKDQAIRVRFSTRIGGMTVGTSLEVITLESFSEAGELVERLEEYICAAIGGQILAKSVPQDVVPPEVALDYDYSKESF